MGWCQRVAEKDVGPVVTVGLGVAMASNSTFRLDSEQVEAQQRPICATFLHILAAPLSRRGDRAGLKRAVVASNPYQHHIDSRRVGRPREVNLNRHGGVLKQAAGRRFNHDRYGHGTRRP